MDIVNVLFFLFRPQNYFGDPWNVLDFVIVVGSLVDIIAAQLMVCEFCKSLVQLDTKTGHVTWEFLF